MDITPLEIKEKQFRRRFRGFDMREVDAFLEEVAESYEHMSTDNGRLREQVRKLRLEVQANQKREESFKMAMLNSQKVLEQMKGNAEKSAELIIAEAEVNAEKILNSAHNRLAQLHEDIAELKRQRMQIEIQIRSVLESHTKLLDIEKEGAKEFDEADEKVKFLKKR